MKICPPTIITSVEVIIAEYDAILGQSGCEDLYNHLSNYTIKICIYLIVKTVRQSLEQSKIIFRITHQGENQDLIFT